MTGRFVICPQKIFLQTRHPSQDADVGIEESVGKGDNQICNVYTPVN